MTATPAPARRVLVADDDIVTRQVLAVRLKAMGFEPQTAATGDRACELAMRSAFDTLLLDVNMPGMSGLEVAQRVRRSDLPQPSIMMISAFPDRAAIGAGLAAGADGYLRKPFDMAQLYEGLMGLHGRTQA